MTTGSDHQVAGSSRGQLVLIELLLAMPKVVGSNPISRFEKAQETGTFVALASRRSAPRPDTRSSASDTDATRGTVAVVTPPRRQRPALLRAHRSRHRLGGCRACRRQSREA